MSFAILEEQVRLNAAPEGGRLASAAAHHALSALERQGDFSQTTDNLGNPYPYIKDPQLTGACSAADQTACFRDGGVLGKIPADRLYPLGLNILKMYPLPNNQSTTIGTNQQFIQPT